MAVEPTEEEWQHTVSQAAKVLGWRCYHTWNSLHSVAGFPDLVCVRGDRLLALELKSGTGRVTPAQLAWLADLNDVTTVRAKVAKPADWDEVESLLKGEG